MKNVYIYCEGPTEESFINKILYPYFLNIGIAIYPIICTAKHTAGKNIKVVYPTTEKSRRTPWMET